jgi:hypothetical protein
MAIYLAYVGPPNATFGVCEQGQTYTDSVGNTWLCTVRGVGVGPAASPATAPIVSAWTSSVATVLPINVYVPNNYYFWMKVTSGSVASSTLGQWYPV